MGLEKEVKKVAKEIELLLPRFKLGDVLQVIIGASILAIPVGFTEEIWMLGETLPIWNVFMFMILSIFFIALFVYYHYHQGRKEHSFLKHHKEFAKRVLSTYILSFAVVAILLTLIQKAPWNVDWVLSFKRVVLTSFPASLSGTIVDMIK